jgi:flagellar biosynthetic protein FliQ
MDTAPLDLVREALLTALMVAAPILVVALVVGLAMALVQTATQVQDQAVSSVPKLVACGAALVLLAGWMAERLLALAVQVWGGGG